MTFGLGRESTFMLGLTTLEEKKSQVSKSLEQKKAWGCCSSGANSTFKATKLVC